MAKVPLGQPVPPHTPHAISASLPTWRDNVAYANKDKRVVDSMVSFYPRILIHPTIRKLEAICKRQYAVDNENCMLFPTQKTATECRDYLKRHSVLPGHKPPQTRLLHLSICSDDRQLVVAGPIHKGPNIDLHTLLFPVDVSSIAQEFWKLTGLGISSRFAEKCLSVLTEDSILERSNTLQPHFEEQGDKHSPTSTPAKKILRRRIAGFLNKDNPDGVVNVTEDDVFLFPGGMATILNVYKLAMEVRPQGKSVCFGFPFVNTLKVLQQWGPGVYHFGNGLEEDIDALEALLEKGSQADPSRPPIPVLFTEFPSNPLLKSPNLSRLKRLADKFDFLIVVDDTVGGFINVDVLPYADILVSSLTKLFSGGCNVMGGSLVLNPKSRHYPTLKAHLLQTYEDIYFDEDAIVMEHNSRDFEERTRVVNANTAAVCAFFHSRSVAGGYKGRNVAIQSVFYPKYITSDQYETYRSKSTDGHEGAGGLLSLTFTSEIASRAFFDALPFYKGITFGTNFTLACLYTIITHYEEMEWATGFGVENGLVRIGVGLEEVEELLGSFEVALKAAEDAKIQSHL